MADVTTEDEVVTPTLFELPAVAEPAPEPPTRPEEARVLRPNRSQLQWLPRDLEAAVPQGHAARAIWDLLERLDLAGFYGDIRAVLARPGRPTTDPRVLLAVWLLGTVEGIGSARQLARLCEEHDAYRWVCGGVPINYHMLSDFRVAHQAALDDLLTQIVARLLAARAVRLERVAQDGMRVRASAGAASFRRKARLETCLAGSGARSLGRTGESTPTGPWMVLCDRRADRPMEASRGHESWDPPAAAGCDGPEMSTMSTARGCGAAGATRRCSTDRGAPTSTSPSTSPRPKTSGSSRRDAFEGAVPARSSDWWRPPRRMSPPSSGPGKGAPTTST
jgi:transposase